MSERVMLIGNKRHNPLRFSCFELRFFKKNQDRVMAIKRDRLARLEKKKKCKSSLKR